jgi:hypothetical protein
MKTTLPMKAGRFSAAMLGAVGRNTTAVERAFQLAKSGRYATVVEIRRTLNLEGYSTHQVTGSTLQRQLRALIQAAREK